MIISVDSGKENTNYFDGNKLGLFKTRYAKDEEVLKGIDSNTYNIVIDGVLYKVGEGANISSLEISKGLLIHKVYIITAISILKIPYDKRKIQLVTGTPINLFFTEEKLKIADGLRGNYSIIFNNNVEEICIDNVIVVPESMGVIYNNYSIYKDKLIKVIDIGGLNTNGCIYKNGKPIRNTVFTLNEGINILINKIRNALNSEGFNYQSYEVEQILINKVFTDFERDIVRDIIIKHLEDIKHNMRANNWNIDTGEVVFTGGGSGLLRGYVKEVFTNGYISNEPLWDNVKGFYNIGVSVL